MIVNQNSNQSQALKHSLFTYGMCYFFLLFHYLREQADAPFVFVYIYVLLKQS